MNECERARERRMLRIYATHDDEPSNRCVMPSRPPHVFAYDRVACQCWIATMVGSMLCLCLLLRRLMFHFVSKIAFLVKEKN